MSTLSTGLLLTIAVVALAATLGASELLVRGVGRLAENLGLLGGLVGLLIALGADAPEISSSAGAIANGSAAAGAGVVLGSNIFNIAVLLGGGALAAGSVRIPKAALLLDAGVAVLVTGLLGGVAIGVLPLWAGWVCLILTFAPYVVILALTPAAIARLPLPRPVRSVLERASRQAAIEGDELEEAIEAQMPLERQRRWRPVALLLPALVVTVAGAMLLVQSALLLGGRWGVPSTLVGVLALAAATSLPNAYAAIRLAVGGHGAAVVSATFNSNTFNLLAGLAVPALFVPGLMGEFPRLYGAWLFGITAVAVVLLWPDRGLRRSGAALLLAVYAAFIVYAVVTS